MPLTSKGTLGKQLHHSFFLIDFFWSLVGLQCCVNFHCTAKWSIIHNIYVLFHLFHYGLLQDIGHSSLCSTLGPCCLSVLYRKAHVCSPQPPAPTLPQPPPPWQPQVCSLCLSFTNLESLFFRNEKDPAAVKKRDKLSFFSCPFQSSFLRQLLLLTSR